MGSVWIWQSSLKGKVALSHSIFHKLASLHTQFVTLRAPEVSEGRTEVLCFTCGKPACLLESCLGFHKRFAAVFKHVCGHLHADEG